MSPDCTHIVRVARYSLLLKRLPPPLREQMTAVLKQTALPPEGQALFEKIQQEAQTDVYGAVVIVRGKETGGSTKRNKLYIRPEDTYARDHMTEDGTRYPASLNRIVFHELAHFAYPHENEEEIIRRANAFMAKYHGEPPRAGHDMYKRPDSQAGVVFYPEILYHKDQLLKNPACPVPMHQPELREVDGADSTAFLETTQELTASTLSGLQNVTPGGSISSPAQGVPRSKRPTRTV